MPHPSSYIYFIITAKDLKLISPCTHHVLAHTGNHLVCPRGKFVEAECTHANTESQITCWTFHGNQPGSAYNFTHCLSHSADMPVDRVGSINFTNISDNSGPNVTSTALIANIQLNGTIVKCWDDHPSRSKSPIINILLIVKDDCMVPANSELILTMCKELCHQEQLNKLMYVYSCNYTCSFFFFFFFYSHKQ